MPYGSTYMYQLLCVCVLGTNLHLLHHFICLYYYLIRIIRGVVRLTCPSAVVNSVSFSFSCSDEAKWRSSSKNERLGTDMKSRWCVARWRRVQGKLAGEMEGEKEFSALSTVTSCSGWSARRERNSSTTEGMFWGRIIRTSPALCLCVECSWE